MKYRKVFTRLKKSVVATSLGLAALTTGQAWASIHQATSNVKGSYSGVQSSKECFTKAAMDNLVAHLDASNVNTYLFAIRAENVNAYCTAAQVANGDGNMTRLEDLVRALAQKNINVWVSFSGIKKTDAGSDHYLNLVKQVTAVRDLGLTNLQGVSIDDFDLYLDPNSTDRYFFSTTELSDIHSELNQRGMAFVPTAYYRSDLLLDYAKLNDYKPYFDGILFPYLFGGSGSDLQVYKSAQATAQIQQVKNLLGSDKALIVDVYGTSYTQDPADYFKQDQSETEYVKEVMEAAHRYADGVMIYRTLNDISNRILYGAPRDPSNSAYNCPIVELPNEEHSHKRDMVAATYARWGSESFPTNNTRYMELTERTKALTMTGSPKVPVSTLNAPDCHWTAAWPDPNRIQEIKQYDDYLYSSPWFEPKGGQPGFEYTRFALAGNFSGSGRDEILSFNLLNGMSEIFGYRVNNDQAHHMDQLGGLNSNGSFYSANPNIFRFEAINKAVAGDFDGDGIDEVATFYDYDYTNNNSPSNPQRIFTFRMSGNQVYPRVEYDTTKYGFNFDSIERAVAGDFDNDGRDELLTFYRYRDAADTQKVLAFEKDPGQVYFNQWQHWKFTFGGVDFNTISAAVAGDFDLENPGDELALFDFSENRIRMFKLYGNHELLEYGYWYINQTPALFNDIVYAAAGDFNGDGKDDIVVSTSPYYRSDSKLSYYIGYPTGVKEFTHNDGDYGDERYFATTPKVIVSGNFYNEDANDKVGPSNVRKEVVSLF